MKISNSALVSFNQENHLNNHFLWKLFALFTFLHFYWKRSDLGGERGGSEEELWLGWGSPPFSSILALTFSEARYCISQPQAHLKTTSFFSTLTMSFSSLFIFISLSCHPLQTYPAQVLFLKKACIRLFSELGMPTWGCMTGVSGNDILDLGNGNGNG